MAVEELATGACYLSEHLSFCFSEDTALPGRSPMNSVRVFVFSLWMGMILQAFIWRAITVLFAIVFPLVCLRSCRRLKEQALCSEK